MPKVKVPRKSTSVDMTAMCDVAFLLLSFFILTTKFKPSEALSVTTPKSVSTKAAEQKDVIMIILDKDNKAYLQVSDDAMEEHDAILDGVASIKGLTITDQEKKNFRRGGSYIGVPFSQLSSFLQLTPEQLKTFKAPGIPTDSANNELQIWMRAALDAFKGGKMNVMIRGDGAAKYPAFKGIIDALKANEIFKFQLMTDPEGVPPGTALYEKVQRGEKTE